MSLKFRSRPWGEKTFFGFFVFTLHKTWFKHRFGAQSCSKIQVNFGIYLAKQKFTKKNFRKNITAEGEGFAHQKFPEMYQVNL